ncbi:MAG: hypothetical protein J1F39_05055, partial [Clostridiales bacterium]|nr:hypothetical protein [Clostridiales bacterium]
AALFYLSYKSYYERKFKKWIFHEIAISMLIALAIQLLISVIVRYPEYLTGAGFYLGKIIYSPNEVTLNTTVIPDFYYIIATLITYPFYFAAIVLGSRLGFKNVQKTLHKHEDDQ